MDNFGLKTEKIYSSPQSHAAATAQQKFFSDAYKLTPSQLQDFDRQNIQALNQLTLKQAELLLAEQLLIETAYIATLANYYEKLYSLRAYSSPYYSSGIETDPNFYEPIPLQTYNNRSFGYSSSYFNYDNYPHKHFHAHPMQHRHKNWLKQLKSLPVQLGREIGGSISNRIVSIARHSLGLPVWAFGPFASLCQRGYLGCAASVSELLQESGLNIKGSPSVANLVSELISSGWHKIKITDKYQFKTGDIVYGLQGNHAHIGIITAAGKNTILVCDNSSSTGTLKERTIESGGSFTPDGRFAGHLYVLRQN